MVARKPRSLPNHTQFSTQEEHNMTTVTQYTPPATGQYIIGSFNKKTGAMSFAPNPVVQTHASAQVEAERLARAYPDKKFVVVEIKGVCSFHDVTWE